MAGLRAAAVRLSESLGLDSVQTDLRFADRGVLALLALRRVIELTGREPGLAAEKHEPRR